MKRNVCLLAVGMVFLITSGAMAEGKFKEQRKQERKQFIETQKSENQAFRESLKDLSKEEKMAAIKSHREAQVAERKEFAEKSYQDKVKRIRMSDQLTDEQKAQKLARLAEKKEQMRSFQRTLKADRNAFKNSLSRDIPQEERRAAMKSFREDQKVKKQAFRESLKSNR